MLFVHIESLDDIIVLPAEFGVIVGPLFERGQTLPVRSLTSAKAEALVTTGGVTLFSEYWGPCCALLHNKGYDYFHAVRDPAGGAPLYMHEADQLQIFFTDLTDFMAIWDEELEADLDMICAYMVQPRLLTCRTAIKNVEELLAGERLTFGRDSWRRDLIWRPLSENKFGLQDFNAAADALRAVIVDCARSWTGFNSGRGGHPIAHRLSGGLDSSIVLAALRANALDPTSVVCFNEYPERTPEGDERALARLAAKHFGFELVEHESRAEAFSYRRILDAPLPVRPTHTELSHAAPELAEAIGALGATLVTSGQGGDQVLHRRRFAASAVDAALDRVGISAWLRIARDTAGLARVPIWDTVFETMGYVCGQRGSLFNPMFARTMLASPAAVSIATEEWRLHPWAEQVARQPPARAARAMHIGDLSYYHEPSAVTRSFQSAPVLASLPVIETVLSMPPYLMTLGGFDRSLARAAFAPDLPEVIRARSHKGDTTRFHNRVLERQLPFMRELLLDGELIKRGLVDRARLEAALKRDVIADGSLKGALMSAFVAEAWLQRFKARTVAKSSGLPQGESAT
ncbi:MAG: asparagine synthase-related protein [Terricaulis sp.]